jgi:ribonuclease P protein component
VRRLITRVQFQAVLASQIVARTGHFALHRLQHAAAAPTNPSLANSVPLMDLFPDSGVWLGALAPKRWARRAVTRNLIKRQIHRMSALQENLFADAAHIVRLRAAFDPRQFTSAASGALRKAVSDELTDLFRIAAKPIHREGML